MAKKTKKVEEPIMDESQTNGEANGATQSMAIEGITFTAPAPYSEGHTINVAEAGTLNQAFAENLRNNFRKKVKEAKDKSGGLLDQTALDALVAEFNDYASKYEFAGKRTSRASVDPVEKEAQKIAGQKIREAFKAKKLDIKGISDEQFDKMVLDLLEKKPEYRELARSRIEAIQSLAVDTLLPDDALAPAAE